MPRLREMEQPARRRPMPMVWAAVGALAGITEGPVQRPSQLLQKPAGWWQPPAWRAELLTAPTAAAGRHGRM